MRGNIILSGNPIFNNIYVSKTTTLENINANLIKVSEKAILNLTESTIKEISVNGAELILENNDITKIYNSSTYYGNNIINVKSGTIGSINLEKGTVYFGDKDTPVSTDTPIVNSGGIKADSLYFYDGKIKGTINVKSVYKPVGYTVKLETINGIDISTLTNIDNPEELIEVNSVGYSDLQSAINACEDSVQTTIKLYGDITLTSNITIPTGKNIILDYNGYSINPDTYTVTNNGTFNEINLKEGNNNLVNQGSTEVTGSAIKITKEDTKNIAIYEDDKGNDLKSNYTVYKFNENKYEQYYLEEKDDFGTYVPINSKNQIKVYPIGGKIYLDNLPYGDYK